jgi:hypothetical protein
VARLVDQPLRHHAPAPVAAASEAYEVPGLAVVEHPVLVAVAAHVAALLLAAARLGPRGALGLALLCGGVALLERGHEALERGEVALRRDGRRDVALEPCERADALPFGCARAGLVRL